VRDKMVLLICFFKNLIIHQIDCIYALKRYLEAINYTYIIK